MSDLNELYQEILLEHNSKPRNFRKLDQANHTADGFNPLCGDRISLYLQVEDGVITDVGFQGTGCAISRASASMMTPEHQGAKAGNRGTGLRPVSQDADGAGCGAGLRPIGRPETLAGVAEFPTRIKCAILAWHTLRAAIEGKSDGVTTE